MGTEQDKYLGVFSTVSISNHIIMKSSELRTSVIPENHHFYMIVGFEKFLIKEVEKVIGHKNKLIIYFQSEFSALHYLVWDGDDEIIDYRKSFDSRTIEINGIPYSILDLVLHYVRTNPNCAIKTEILYIGQAKGVKVSRNTGERLKSHSTLQNILAESIDSKKQLDIRIISFSVSEKLMWTNLTTVDTSNASTDHIYDISGRKFEVNIPESSMINLVEAKLINFFKPEYNKKNKNVPVPSKKHTNYKEYNIFFNRMDIDGHLYKLQKL